MPIYVYEIAEGPEAGQRFEVMQRMSEPALTVHPETGAAVHRVVARPGVVRHWGTQSAAKLMSDSSLKRNGFARYEKGSDGTYQKTGGVGPETFKR